MGHGDMMFRLRGKKKALDPGAELDCLRRLANVIVCLLERAHHCNWVPHARDLRAILGLPFRAFLFRKVAGTLLHGRGKRAVPNPAGRDSLIFHTNTKSINESIGSTLLAKVSFLASACGREVGGDLLSGRPGYGWRGIGVYRAW